MSGEEEEEEEKEGEEKEGEGEGEERKYQVQERRSSTWKELGSHRSRQRTGQ